jgi:hypothetical protein
MGTGFPFIVIPGFDPGIAPTDGVRGDPRITSGDDDDGAGCPAESSSDVAVILMPMGPVPAMTMRTRFQSP